MNSYFSQGLKTKPPTSIAVIFTKLAIINQLQKSHSTYISLRFPMFFRFCHKQMAIFLHFPVVSVQFPMVIHGYPYCFSRGFWSSSQAALPKSSASGAARPKASQRGRPSSEVLVPSEGFVGNICIYDIYIYIYCTSYILYILYNYIYILYM